MATITRFTLKNFKGAEHVEIDLKRRQTFPVVTLLGLNESGKTTILEGISKFVSEDGTTKDIFKKQHATDSPSSFIPKHREAAFSGRVSIEAVIELGDDDREAITDTLQVAPIGKFDIEGIKDQLTVEACYTFEDSDLSKSRTWWDGIVLSYVPEGKRKAVKYARPESADGGQDYWASVVACIAARLPKITYFPSFLVDVPERIYLEEHEDEDAINRYYRSVLQDVLDTSGESLSIERHVVARIAEFKRESEQPAWISLFFGTDKKKQIDAVFSKMSSAISREIIGNWARIFQRPTDAKNINLSWAIDASKNDIPYASFTITDGESSFEVNQRSLGFRWFFSFLLFTRFRRGQDRQTIFLFDEPAANLHAKAQAELLSSFGRIVEDGNQIIYSTHSHHMIEPKWLNGAYIVENLAIDYDDAETIDHFLSRPTEVVAKRYRDFLSQSPERSSYYLPALEKLQYFIPPIAKTRDVIVVEGISDYNMFRYVAEQRGISGVCFVPGVSASNMGPLISLLIGLSHNFGILFDDDKPGRKERDRYRADWSLESDRAVSLGDLSQTFRDMKLEALLSKESRRLLLDHFGISKNLRKKQIQLYLAESVAISAPGRLSEDTMDLVAKAISLMVKRIRVDV